MCEECGGQEGGCKWVILHVMRNVFFTLSMVPSSFCVVFFIRSVSGIGGQEGGCLRMLMVSDQRHGGSGHFLCHG